MHMSRFATSHRPSVWQFKKIAPYAWMFAFTLLVVSSSGCASVIGKRYSNSEKIDLTPVKREGYTVGPYGVMQPFPTTDDSPSIILEVNHGKRSFERVPLVPNQPMFVADLVRDADFYRKIGKVRVIILRPNGNNPPVRLDVDFDSSGKRVEEGMNYSLRPGDHVVVTADDRTVLNRIAGGTVFGKVAK